MVKLGQTSFDGWCWQYRKYRQAALVLWPQCHSWQLFCDSGKGPALLLLDIIAGNALTKRQPLDKAAAQLTASHAGAARPPFSPCTHSPTPLPSPHSYLKMHMHCAPHSTRLIIAVTTHAMPIQLRCLPGFEQTSQFLHTWLLSCS